MPDIPIDTLFIIGLVIASFVGKIFQKNQAKKPLSSKPQNSSKLEEPKPSLGDILKDAWERANQQDEIQPEFSKPAPPPPLPQESEEKVLQIKEEVVLPKANLTINTLAKQNTAYQHVKLKNHFGIKRELLSNTDTLKKAFVLKEILDKPVSLRTLPF
jgi:hypothetical protein